ncbi:MAG TPA: phosphatase PAP2 family protein [bacterium]|nr:phosphatase PAP2 family protein [bacterium]
MRPITITERGVFIAGVYALFFACYLLANRVISVGHCFDFTTRLDGSIPFIPEFIYPFYLAYVLILLPGLLVRDRRLLYRSGAGFAALIVVSCALFFLVPVYVPRPEAVPPTIAGALVAGVYQGDRPVCGFPSLHVSASMFAALTLLRERKGTGAVMLGFAALTALATLFVKQHVMLDVAGGVVLAMAAERFFLAGWAESAVNGLKAGGLLLRSFTERPHGADNPRVRESRSSTPEGVEYDLYEPASRPGARTFILVTGLTVSGEKDHRLVNFARCLAESGITAAAVSLPGLKNCRFSEADVGRISDLAAYLDSRSGEKPGVIAFSFGAGLALLAAADEKNHGHLDPVILFGPYHFLPEVLDQLARKYNRAPESGEDWDNYVWLRTLLAYRDRDKLGLDQEEMKELMDLAGSYCSEPSLARKRAFHERTLSRLYPSLSVSDLESEPLARLSPASRLADVRARVLILHDANDILVPPEQSRRIFAELGSRPAGGGQRLLITPWLSHVTARSAWKILDVFRILSIMGEIFRRPAESGRGRQGSEAR